MVAGFFLYIHDDGNGRYTQPHENQDNDVPSQEDKKEKNKTKQKTKQTKNRKKVRKRNKITGTQLFICCLYVF